MMTTAQQIKDQCNGDVYQMLEESRLKCFEVAVADNGMKRFIFADNSSILFDLTVRNIG